MTIREARDLLKGELPDSGYEYGFYLNGVKHRPDPALSFGVGFQRALLTDYRIPKPRRSPAGENRHLQRRDAVDENPPCKPRRSRQNLAVVRSGSLGGLSGINAAMPKTLVWQRTALRKRRRAQLRFEV